jgi:hypothetical protein
VLASPIGGVAGAAGGVAVGPLIGYKLITRQGFTFFVPGGAEYVFAHAEASDQNGNSGTASKAEVIPLLNLNLGWSFREQPNGS